MLPMSENLFQNPSDTPLAEAMRPESLDDIVGQEHLLAPGAPFRRALDTGSLGSFILWGPPGTGKTTLALAVASRGGETFVRFSAVTGGVADVRKIVARAAELRKSGSATMLFVDEIHRFNRAQQDAFLPHVENGTIRLCGATTENPSFHVNAPLLSRCAVYVLRSITDESLSQLIERTLGHSVFLQRYGVQIPADVIRILAMAADGDARRALNLLETVAGSAGDEMVTVESARKVLKSAPLLYDRSGEEHYNHISALHKSMRSSDVDASLYWLARMIRSGDDPLYIGRRIVRFATEDVGMADPSALTVAMRAVDCYRFLGSPEGDLALAEAVVYLALAPKSNSVYTAWGKALKLSEEKGSLPVPLHLRNAPTSLMKTLDYGKGYQYAHDSVEGLVTHENFPDGLPEQDIYTPGNRGREERISEILADWKERRNAARRKGRE
jgi:putative ATPase